MSVIFIASAVILIAIALWMRPMVRILVKRKPAGEPVRLSDSEADEDLESDGPAGGPAPSEQVQSSDQEKVVP